MNTETKKPVVAIIAAVSHDGIYGINTERGPALPWMDERGRSMIPEDMEHFVSHTTNHTVIMGSATFASLSNKPLKNRRNIVVTSKQMLQDGVAFARNFENAYTLACAENAERVYLIGGKSLIEYILQRHLDVVDEMYVTVIRKNYGPANGVLLGTDADHPYVRFPMLLNPEKNHPFEEIASRHINSKVSDVPVSFYAYEKITVENNV